MHQQHRAQALTTICPAATWLFSSPKTACARSTIPSCSRLSATRVELLLQRRRHRPAIMSSSPTYARLVTADEGSLQGITSSVSPDGDSTIHYPDISNISQTCNGYTVRSPLLHQAPGQAGTRQPDPHQLIQLCQCIKAACLIWEDDHMALQQRYSYVPSIE
eukprot:GHUV01021820.1.p1 GENE.GHUV01021820.1~~GHUV01021820.1.p1  ORF type:complete len:162 (+),score=23.92 GHUV01021820.1:687-1172(+)